IAAAAASSSRFDDNSHPPYYYPQMVPFSVFLGGDGTKIAPTYLVKGFRFEASLPTSMQRTM
ncbi:unnamed protein product, partial [Ascophyllum nodosum]